MLTVQPTSNIQTSHSVPTSSLSDILPYVASQLYQPLDWSTKEARHYIYSPLTPGKNGNYDSEAIEVIRRTAALTFYSALLPATYSLSVVGGFIDLLGQSLASMPTIQSTVDSRPKARLQLTLKTPPFEIKIRLNFLNLITIHLMNL